MEKSKSQTAPLCFGIFVFVDDRFDAFNGNGFHGSLCCGQAISGGAF